MFIATIMARVVSYSEVFLGRYPGTSARNCTYPRRIGSCYKFVVFRPNGLALLECEEEADGRRSRAASLLSKHRDH